MGRGPSLFQCSSASSRVGGLLTLYLYYCSLVTLLWQHLRVNFIKSKKPVSPLSRCLFSSFSFFFLPMVKLPLCLSVCVWRGTCLLWFTSASSLIVHRHLWTPLFRFFARLILCHQRCTFVVQLCVAGVPSLLLGVIVAIAIVAEGLSSLIIRLFASNVFAVTGPSDIRRTYQLLYMWRLGVADSLTLVVSKFKIPSPSWQPDIQVRPNVCINFCHCA